MTAAGPAGARIVGQDFFLRLAYAIAGATVFAFAFNAAGGHVDIPRVPWWVHVHAAAMMAWFGIYVAQNRLTRASDKAMHRALGWSSVALVVANAPLSWFSGIMAISMHRTPAFYTPPYFLALALVETAAFTALVLAAVGARRDIEAHRRLVAGASLVVSEPALVRLLPMAALGGEPGETIILVIQFCVVAVIALHDRRALGKIHPATFAVGGAVATIHLLIALGSRSTPIIAFAERLAGA